MKKMTDRRALENKWVSMELARMNKPKRQLEEHAVFCASREVAENDSDFASAMAAKRDELTKFLEHCEGESNEIKLNEIEICADNFQRVFLYAQYIWMKFSEKERADLLWYMQNWPREFRRLKIGEIKDFTHNLSDFRYDIVKRACYFEVSNDDSELYMPANRLYRALCALDFKNLVELKVNNVPLAHWNELGYAGSLFGKHHDYSALKVLHLNGLDMRSRQWQRIFESGIDESEVEEICLRNNKIVADRLPNVVMSKAFPGMRVFDLSGNHSNGAVSMDRLIRSLAKYAHPQLEVLGIAGLDGCPNIDRPVFREMINSFSNLRKLIVSEEVYERARRNCPRDDLEIEIYKKVA